MKPRILFAIALCLSIYSGAFAQTQGMDKELSDLTEKLATKIKACGKKKITVLDFTDLNGGTSDLGKYVAEQLTVDFVSGDRDFVVVDRANLKKILAEHKLTATGLIDPENAKKLGQFSGVDALVLGTVVPMNPNVKLTVKIITTDTADIIGGGQCSFKSDENVQQLLSHTTSESSSEAQAEGKSEGSKTVDPRFINTFGDLSITFEALRGMQDGSVVVDLVFQNKSTRKTIAVSMFAGDCYFPPCNLRSSLTGADGTKWQSNSSTLVGIMGTANPKYLTPIEPGGTLKASMTFRTFDRISDSLTSLRLQSEIVVNANYRESQYNNYQVDSYHPGQRDLPPFCKTVNLSIDIPVNRAGK